jgi:cytochrome o ubiquinol oxidase subunit 2
MLLISGCSKMEVMNPMGPIAAQEKELLITAVLLMLIVVIPVIILTFVIAYKYRASNTKAKYSPEFSHSNKLEAIWWTIPIIIISILASITWITTHKLDPYRPLDSQTKPITIQVVSLEWRWLFIYPDQNIATMNFVEFPANTPVNFEITSDAPMNSFQIQQLAGQIYAMAGMRTKLHLIADQPGDYYGRSVSFSGDGFSNMQFIARAATQSDFNKWVKSVQQSPNKLTMAVYNTLAPASNDSSVITYSSVDKGLFNTIMMKYMMPVPPVVPPAKGTQTTNYKSDRDTNHHKDLINPKTNELIKG